MTTRKKRFTKVPVDTPISELSHLNVQCGSTKCEDGLHCFRLTKAQIKKMGKSGVCKNCGIDIVDWKRIYERNPMDAEFIFKSLKNELIRQAYWSMPITEADLEKAYQRGPAKIEGMINNRMTNVIGIEKPWRNGYTPYSGDVIYYAQHATATCCRRCMEYWYNIPQGRQLTTQEVSFSSELIKLYLQERIPDLFNKFEVINIHL